MCRDFAHLGIALCRALGIPARFVSAYAYGLNPPDFHAHFEAFLGGRWILADPTRLSPQSSRQAGNALLRRLDHFFDYVDEMLLSISCSFSMVTLYPGPTGLPLREMRTIRSIHHWSDRLRSGNPYRQHTQPRLLEIGFICRLKRPGLTNPNRSPART